MYIYIYIIHLFPGIRIYIYNKSICRHMYIYNTFICRHMCMTMRGISKTLNKTITSSMLGVFRSDPKTREEFLSHIQASRWRLVIITVYNFWPVQSYTDRSISYDLLFISYYLLFISYDLWFISYDLWFISYDLLFISYDLLFISYDFLFISYDLLFIVLCRKSNNENYNDWKIRGLRVNNKRMFATRAWAW